MELWLLIIEKRPFCTECLDFVKFAEHPSNRQSGCRHSGNRERVSPAEFKVLWNTLYDLLFDGCATSLEEIQESLNHTIYFPIFII